MKLVNKPDWDLNNPYHTPYGEKVVVTYKKRKHLFQTGGKLGKSADLLRYGYSYPKPKVPFSDIDNKTWLNWWYSGRGKQLEQTHSNDIQKYIDEAVETPVTFAKQPKNRPTLGGVYRFKDRNITLYPYSKTMDNEEGRNALLHEQVHALNAAPLQAHDIYTDGPYMHIVRLDLQKQLGNNFDYYWDDSDEIYSRLMEFRKQNKLHPAKYQDKEQIKKWRDSGKLKQFMLDRYDDDTLLYLFNEIAQNNSTKNAGYYAAKGAKLISRE